MVSLLKLKYLKNEKNQKIKTIIMNKRRAVENRSRGLLERVGIIVEKIVEQLPERHFILGWNNGKVLVQTQCPHIGVRNELVLQIRKHCR